MIDKKIFQDLRKEINDKDKVREEIILKSRPIIKKSKQAIYALHRDSDKEAKKNIDFAEKSIHELKKIFMKNQGLRVGIYNSALQEYAEAITYYYFVKEKKLISNKKLDIGPENYLLGLCDLTGELARRAVFSVVKENYSEIIKIKEFVEEIYNEFLEFELRNGELRKKSDSIKWNMKKIEEILYDLKIRGKI